MGRKIITILYQREYTRMMSEHNFEKKIKLRFKKVENFRHCTMSVGVKEGWSKNMKKKCKKNLKKKQKSHEKTLNNYTITRGVRKKYDWWIN